MSNLVITSNQNLQASAVEYTFIDNITDCYLVCRPYLVVVVAGVTWLLPQRLGRTQSLHWTSWNGALPLPAGSLYESHSPGKR